MLDRLIAEVEAFATTLRGGRSSNINDQSSKDRAISLATYYFSDVRPALIDKDGAIDLLAEHDERWQKLVRLAHGTNKRSSYVRILKELKAGLVEFRVAALVGVGQVPVTNTEPVFTQEEVLILKTLTELVPSAAASYRQALEDLTGSERISYRGTAAEFRESIRETLDHLAPDAEVAGQPGFTLEPGTTKPTMKQKFRHVLTSRGLKDPQQTSAEKALGVVDSLSGDVMRAVYSRASLATHLQASKAEVRKIKRYVDTLFFDLLALS